MEHGKLWTGTYDLLVPMAELLLEKLKYRVQAKIYDTNETRTTLWDIIRISKTTALQSCRYMKNKTNWSFDVKLERRFDQNVEF